MAHLLVELLRESFADRQELSGGRFLPEFFPIPPPKASSRRKTAPQTHLVSASETEPVWTSSLRRDLGSSRTVCTRYSFMSQNGLFYNFFHS